MHSKASIIVQQTLSEAIQISHNIGATSVSLLALTGFANLHYIDGNYDQCAILLGLITDQPELDDYVNETRIEPLLQELEDHLPEQKFVKAINRGRNLDLNEVISDLLPNKIT